MQTGERAGGVGQVSAALMREVRTVMYLDVSIK